MTTARYPISEQLHSFALRAAARLRGVTLSRGAHRDPAHGTCLLEAVSVVSGGIFGDHPTSVSPILSDVGRTLNDSLADDARQHLKALVPYLIGTATDGRDSERADMASNWIARTYAPAWLEAGGLVELAQELRATTPHTLIRVLRAAELAVPQVRLPGSDRYVAYCAERAVRQALGCKWQDYSYREEFRPTLSADALSEAILTLARPGWYGTPNSVSTALLTSVTTLYGAMVMLGHTPTPDRTATL